MKDLLKNTAYAGIGLAASASDAVKEAVSKMKQQAKEGEQIVEQVLELNEFQLPSDFMLNEEEIIANIQYNS